MSSPRCLSPEPRSRGSLRCTARLPQTWGEKLKEPAEKRMPDLQQRRTRRTVSAGFGHHAPGGSPPSRKAPPPPPSSAPAAPAQIFSSAPVPSSGTRRTPWRRGPGPRGAVRCSGSRVFLPHRGRRSREDKARAPDLVPGYWGRQPSRRSFPRPGARRRCLQVRPALDGVRELEAPGSAVRSSWSSGWGRALPAGKGGHCSGHCRDTV